MTVFEAMGPAFAAVLGRKIEFSINEDLYEIRAILDLNRKKVEVGEYGASVTVADPRVDIAIADAARAGLSAEDFDHARFSHNGKQYILTNIEQDDAMIKCSAFLD